MPASVQRSVAFAVRRRTNSASAFTLVELLIVIAILAILAALLLPSLVSARHKSWKAACLANLRQVGIAITAYAGDNDGLIPYGPKAPPFTSAGNFYPSTGSPTSLVSLQNGAPVGLGLLLHDHLANQPKALFCPGSDQSVDAAAELARVGTNQAQCSYYYRHAGVTNLFDPPTASPPLEHLALDNLGKNRQGLPIRALAMDTLFLCPPDLALFNIKPRTHHRQQFVNILFADGHTLSRPNRNDRFVVDLRTYAEIRDAFNKILGVLEEADAEH